MEVDGEKGKPGKHSGGQVCQICGDGVGTTVDGDIFVACDVCGFPVCRPCYEYERKDGNQSCPQCKTKYKRHRGSPPVRGEEGDDGDADDVSDFNYPTGNQDQKPKITERMLGWHMSHEQGEDIGPPKYDSGEIPRNHIPLLTHSQGVCDFILILS